ncbi:MAG: ECF-type sigma factor [Pseudomonadota bacterium]
MIKSDIDSLFLQASGGDRAALDKVFAVVYPSLKKIARGYLYAELRNQTLQATALVNETYLKLAGTGSLSWEDRKHFLTIAARSMRQVLVDYARARNADKRAPGAERVPLLTQVLPEMPEDAHQLLALEEALCTLERNEPRHAMLVNLRYFAGLSIEEAASVLDISPATAKRDWTVARLWLLHELA